MTWLKDAFFDIDQWSLVMPKDADGNPIDWRWVASLDVEAGLGAGRAVLQTQDPVDPQTIHDALQSDYAVRDRLEAIIAQCSTAFMTDFDRVVAAYRLPRALAWANRRLNDDINLLLDAGVRQRLWTVSHEHQGRAVAVVLKPVAGTSTADVPGQGMLEGTNGFAQPVAVDLDDIRDRTAEILNARAARRTTQRFQKRSGGAAMARANLSGARVPGGSGVSFSSDARDAASQRSGDPSGSRFRTAYGKSYPQSDWRDAYLPGRDVGVVMGIDIETTGTDPARDYIIDAGFEFMNMAGPRSGDGAADFRYEQSYYEAGDAWGQSRLGFGVPDAAAAHGNDFIRKLTGIDIRQRGASQGFRLFDEWPEAQTSLLTYLTAQPYVAHNATFEHGWFMLNMAGYAEAYRAGKITIIDTMPMSRQWDPGSAPSEGHPYGSNALDAYAKRQGALDPSHKERHLGLEDAHIMLVAMKHHLATLKAEGHGPWGAGGRPGVGGKSCGRKW